MLTTGKMNATIAVPIKMPEPIPTTSSHPALFKPCPDNASLHPPADWTAPSQAAPTNTAIITSKRPMKSKIILIIMTTSQNIINPLLEVLAPIANKMSAMMTKMLIQLTARPKTRKYELKKISGKSKLQVSYPKTS